MEAFTGLMEVEVTLGDGEVPMPTVIEYDGIYCVTTQLTDEETLQRIAWLEEQSQKLKDALRMTMALRNADIR